MPILASAVGRVLTVLNRSVAPPPPPPVVTGSLSSFNQQIPLSTLNWALQPGVSEPFSARLFSSSSLSTMIDLATPVGTDFTIEIKLRQTPGNDSVPFGIESVANNQGFGYTQYNNGLSGIWFHNRTTNQESGITASRFSTGWQTVAVVRQGNNISYYSTHDQPGTMTRNVVDILPFWAAATSYQKLWLGRSPYISPNFTTFDGQFESIRISNIARYTQFTHTEPTRLEVDANTVDLVKIITT